MKGYVQDFVFAALSADGRVALTTSSDRGPAPWDLGDLREIVADPAEYACGPNNGLNISRAEWTRFAGGSNWSEYGGGRLRPDALSACLIGFYFVT